MKSYSYIVETFLIPPLLLVVAIFATISQLVLWVPALCFRKLIYTYVKYSSHLKLGEPLDPFSIVMSDKLHRDKLALIAVLKVKGTNVAKTIEEIIETKVLLMKLRDSPKLRYLQLKQYPYCFIGHWFWKDEEAFSVADHIKRVEVQDITQHEISSLSFAFQLASNADFVKNKSPWNITVFEDNFEENYSVVMVRFHHSMADGKSVVKFVVEGLGQTPLKAAQAKDGLYLLPWTHLPLYPIYSIKLNFDMLMVQRRSRYHPWKSNVMDDSPFIMKTSKEFSLKDIKLAGEKYNNARTSAIILAAVSGASLKFLRSNYPKSEYWSYLPLMCALPKENHPEYLTNHASAGHIFSPDIELSNRDRVQECENMYTYLRETSMLPICFNANVNFGASLVRQLRTRMPPPEIYVSVITNVPGSNEAFSIGNSPCLDFCVSARMSRSSVGVSFVVSSYKSNIRITVVTKKSIMNKIQCQDLVGLVQSEMTGLLNKA